MKKIKIKLLSAALLCMSLSVMAQEKGHYLSIEGGVGMSSLMYKLPEGERNNGIGGSAELGYSYFFNRHWGIGTGFGISTYSTRSVFNNYLTTFANAVDDQGDVYDKNVYLNNWKERQRNMMLEIPLTLQFQHKFGEKQRHGLYANLGLKVQIPVMRKFDVKEGEMDIQGYYPEWNVTLYDMPEHGFSTFTDYHPSGKYDMKTGLALTAAFGGLFGISEKVDFFFGITADYGFLNTKSASQGSLVYESGTDILYNNALSSSATEKVHPLSVRGELGFRFRLGGAESQKTEKRAKEQKRRKGEEDAAVVEEVVVKEKERIKDENIRVEEKVETKAVGVDEKTKPVEKEVKTREVKESTITERPQGTTTTKKEEEKPQSPKSGATESKTKATISKKESDIVDVPVDNYNIGVYFLDPVQKDELDEKIAILKKYPDMKVRLEGNTCDLGTDAVNYKVGAQRAEAVKKYMIDEGISASRISTVSKGKSNPIVPNDSEENRKKNRRVDVIIITK